MANLIGANVSVGLKQALPMMYCRIHGVRTAFLEIFATALKRGASFEGLSDTIEVERYNELLDVSSIADITIFHNNSSVLLDNY